MTLIGYLVDGKFVCCDCLVNPDRCDPPAVLIHRENVGACSAACTSCKEVVVKGSDHFMFGEKPLHTFGWNNAALYEVEIGKARDAEDWEKMQKLKNEFYVLFVKALVHNQLEDRDRVLRTAEWVGTMKSPW